MTPRPSRRRTDLRSANCSRTAIRASKSKAWQRQGFNPAGAQRPHWHRVTEEIYYVLAGHGRMRIGESIRDVGPGDAIAIPPGEVHEITNTGTSELRFLCCCAPAYEHEDTVLYD